MLNILIKVTVSNIVIVLISLIVKFYGKILYILGICSEFSTEFHWFQTILDKTLMIHVQIVKHGLRVRVDRVESISSTLTLYECIEQFAMHLTSTYKHMTFYSKYGTAFTEIELLSEISAWIWFKWKIFFFINRTEIGVDFFENKIFEGWKKLLKIEKSRKNDNFFNITMPNLYLKPIYYIIVIIYINT